MSNSLAEAATKVLDVLSPLDSPGRLRVVQAVLTLLGENVSLKSGTALKNRDGVGDDDEQDNDDDLAELSPQGKTWVRKHHLTREQLDHVFHIEKGNVQPISLPGASKKRKEQVQNTYLVQGVASLLSSGDASFSDDDARKLCEHFGCYDPTNHTKYVKELGNRVTGSKSTGWKLTAPGLEAAAELIKQTSQNA